MHQCLTSYEDFKKHMEQLNITLKQDSGFEVFGTIYLLLSSRVVMIKERQKNKEIYPHSSPGRCPAITGHVGKLFIMDMQRVHQFRTAGS